MKEDIGGGNFSYNQRNVKVLELKDNEETSIFKCVEGNEKQYLEGHLLPKILIFEKEG